MAGERGGILAEGHRSSGIRSASGSNSLTSRTNACIAGGASENARICPWTTRADSSEEDRPDRTAEPLTGTAPRRETAIAMDVERNFALFHRHHRDPRNIAFHLACGLAYLSLVVSLVGMPALIAYGAFVTCAFRGHAPAAITATTGAWLGAEAIDALGMPVALRAVGVVVSYLLPELSHWLTGEQAMLDRTTLTPRSLALNFLLLPPYSIACLYRTPVRR